MKNSTTNLLNMIRATLLYCTNNAAITALIAAFAAAKTAIDNKMVLISQLEQIALGTSIGVTLDTNEIRTAMTNIAFKCCNALTAYAASVNNNTLLLKVNYTASDFTRFKKEEIEAICQTIHNEANTNLVAAGPFGYDATDVSDLQTAINLYGTSIQNPRQSVISKSLALVQIDSMVRDIIDRGFKLGLDKMTNTLKLSHPVFVTGYFKAREILNIGTTSAKIRGSVHNPLGTVLFGVRVYLTQSGQNTVILETTTDLNGKFSINHIPAADYDVHYQFEGYQSFTETDLHIPAGKEFTRNTTLQFITSYSVEIPVGEFRVIFSPSTPVWRPGISLNFKNIIPIVTPSSASGYEAYSPTDPGPGSGDITLPSGQNITILSIPAANFKPYLCFANTGSIPVIIEITIL